MPSSARKPWEVVPRALGSEVVNHPPAASARGRKVNSMGQHVDLVGV